MSTQTQISGRIARHADFAQAFLSDGDTAQLFLESFVRQAAAAIFALSAKEGYVVEAVGYKVSISSVGHEVQPGFRDPHLPISSPAVIHSEYTINETYVVEGDVPAGRLSALPFEWGLKRHLALPFVKVQFKTTVSRSEQEQSGEEAAQAQVRTQVRVR